MELCALYQLMSVFSNCSIPPTSLLPGAAYHLLGRAFQGDGVTASSPEELRQALETAFTRVGRRRGRPIVINVVIDPTSSRKPQVRISSYTHVAYNYVTKWLLIICSSLVPRHWLVMCDVCLFCLQEHAWLTRSKM